MAKIQHLVNWYYGNYCTRKCYNDIEKQREHYQKLQELAQKLNGLEMKHSEFVAMMRDDKTICDLNDVEWKSRTFSWKNSGCLICKKLGL